MKPADVLGAQSAAQGVKADSLRESPRLVRQGLSEFQKMWAEVYQKTEEVTRNSGVGGPPPGSPEGQSEAYAPGTTSTTRVFALQGGSAEKEGMTLSTSGSAGTVGSASDRAQAPSFRVGFSPQRMPVSAESQEAGTGIPVGMQGARFGVGSVSPSYLFPPVLPGTKGVMPPELLSSPLFTQASETSLPMEAADVAAFRAVLDHLRALDPKSGQTVVLQLPPESLGDLRVEVSVTGREVRTDWTTPNAEVAMLLDGNQIWLRDALAQQGLNMEHFSVNVGDPNGYFEESDRRTRHEGGGRTIGRGSFVQLDKVLRKPLSS